MDTGSVAPQWGCDGVADAVNESGGAAGSLRWAGTGEPSEPAGGVTDGGASAPSEPAEGVTDGGAGAPAEPAGGVTDGGAVATVAGFRGWLSTVDVARLSDRERVDLVACLEGVRGAASAAQARATDALRCSREVVAPQDVGRSVGSVVALARRE